MKGLRSRFVKRHLDRAVTSTNLDLGSRSEGKVRDIYRRGDQLVLVTTDRQSAFDKVLVAIPFKGQVLNQLSAWWFTQTADIVGNHLIAAPHPNVSVVEPLEVFGFEVIVRDFNTGSTNTSIWTNYAKGVRNFCGNLLSEGMVKNQRLNKTIITPTTNAPAGQHDEGLTKELIVESGLATQEEVDKIWKIAFRLFERGKQIAAKGGLILVDTKYEFGKDKDGNIFLVDEIHTPDSSRFWIARTYERRFIAGEEPESVDKEFLRLWFTEHCDPYANDELPSAPEELVIRMSQLYVDCFQRLTGQQFVPNLVDDFEASIITALEYFQPERLAALPSTTLEVVLGSRNDLPQVRNTIRFFAALEQMTVRTHVCSCHRNPEDLRQYTLRVGGAGHDLTVDAVIAAAGKAAQLPPVLKSWLVAKKQPGLPVFGVALKGSTDQADQAAILSISEVPSKPVEMADYDNPYFGQAGMFQAFQDAVGRKFGERTIESKPAEWDIKV